MTPALPRAPSCARAGDPQFARAADSSARRAATCGQTSATLPLRWGVLPSTMASAAAFACPKCGLKLKAVLEQETARVRCVGCGEEFIVELEDPAADFDAVDNPVDAAASVSSIPSVSSTPSAPASPASPGLINVPSVISLDDNASIHSAPEPPPSTTPPASPAPPLAGFLPRLPELEFAYESLRGLFYDTSSAPAASGVAV